jgi:hypothetical protein
MRTIVMTLGRLLRIRRVSANKPSVEEMERQVALLRQKIRYLQVIAMRSGHSSKDLERAELVALYRLTMDAPPHNLRPRYNVCQSTW